ncbi:hypothetical protein FACS1894166_13490 [Bacilli bacterium]|nr:hypothetical protein FACS1894166_13490 [Bacilli bacterium]
MDLSGVQFSAPDMTTGGIVTGYTTFSSVIFTKLTSINFADAVFASTNTGGHTTTVQTAMYTFAYSDFPKMTNLNLNGAIFAEPNMTSGNITTGRLF